MKTKYMPPIAKEINNIPISDLLTQSVGVDNSPHDYIQGNSKRINAVYWDEYEE